MPSLVEIYPVILEKKIFKFCQSIFAILLLSPLGKERDIHLNTFESSSPKDALCQVWLKLSQWFLRRRCKCEKFTDRRTTDHRRSEKLIWASAKKLMYMSLIEYTVLNTIIFLLYINSMVCIETIENCHLCKSLSSLLIVKLVPECWLLNSESSVFNCSNELSKRLIFRYIHRDRQTDRRTDSKEK